MTKYIIRSYDDVKAALMLSSHDDVLLFSFEGDSILFRFKITKTGMRFVPFKPGETIDGLPPAEDRAIPVKKLVTLQ